MVYDIRVERTLQQILREDTRNLLLCLSEHNPQWTEPDRETARHFGIDFLNYEATDPIEINSADCKDPSEKADLVAKLRNPQTARVMLAQKAKAIRCDFAGGIRDITEDGQRTGIIGYGIKLRGFDELLKSYFSSEPPKEEDLERFDFMAISEDSSSGAEDALRKLLRNAYNNGCNDVVVQACTRRFDPVLQKTTHCYAGFGRRPITRPQANAENGPTAEELYRIL
ncbi:hypothetical protein JW826_03885 [Candidatus Woesearchaeota archaeon]|nr:hypothetical protein [Candidatus Woesearchaeota archaeon]